MLSLPELACVHDRYLDLAQIARERSGGSLAGKLLFRSGFDADSVAILIAASVTGAASLCADADGAPLREGLRYGFCDFVVNSLDEALRILKNELRRARPVSVGVIKAPQVCIEEMLDRGLQPDLLSPGTSASEAQLFLERGALRIPEQPRAFTGTSLLLWTATQPAQTLPRLAGMAGEALDPARSDTQARLRWLESAPRYLGRAFGPRQCLRMTAAEEATFLPRAHAEFPSTTFLHEG
jgi:hypothetical protein